MVRKIAALIALGTLVAGCEPGGMMGGMGGGSPAAGSGTAGTGIPAVGSEAATPSNVSTSPDAGTSAGAMGGTGM